MGREQNGEADKKYFERIENCTILNNRGTNIESAKIVVIVTKEIKSLLVKVEIPTIVEESAFPEKLSRIKDDETETVVNPEQTTIIYNSDTFRFRSHAPLRTIM
ncbi:12481_t:CDS:2, partial [Racocetra persica]